MLHQLLRRRRLFRRRFSSQPTPHASPDPLKDLPPSLPSLPTLLQKPLPASSPSSPHRSVPLYALAGSLVSSLAVAAYLFSSPPADRRGSISDQFYSDLEQTLEKSKGSVRRILDQMRQTGAAAAVLWKSLASVLSSANQEVLSGFEMRVAALLADIAAANAGRRAAIVGAGRGAVLDWLLESVAVTGSNGQRAGTQAEAARALAHLIADPKVSAAVLGRPHAIPNLLRFIFSFQPDNLKKLFKHSSLDGSDHSKGRSMLVAALMDVITSNCDHSDFSSFHPLLPGNADMRDIAAAIQVVEHGGMYFHDHDGNDDDDDGDRGMKGIGIKVVGGTTVLGFSGGETLLKPGSEHNHMLAVTPYISTRLTVSQNVTNSPKIEKLSLAAVPGLWDDLQREHVAVPFATWALANWALASDLNRSHIQELDSDGTAVMTALTAPERSVKWHGSLMAHALLDDQSLPLSASVPDWSLSLLSTSFLSTENKDISLAQIALSTFLVSVERCNESKAVIRQKGLHLLRGIAKQTEKYDGMQESLARVLGLLYSGDILLPLEESQKWSGILLRWVFGQSSAEKTRLTAINILSCMLEDYGPFSVPISQGWLAIMLSEALAHHKTLILRGNNPPQSDRNQVDHFNASSATQVANQLATAVIKLSGIQSEAEPGSDEHPLAYLLSLEPFVAARKSINKKSSPKIDAADSALAALKGIKALAELCSEDAVCQNKIANFGVLLLLRRFLLGDDYEKLAANETYDASRAREVQNKNSAGYSDSSAVDSTDPSSVRVPPAAHIRRHAARLLTILSVLPNAKKAIAADEMWCKWLEDCASGRTPYNDIKLKSYCRLTLFNVFCPDKAKIEGVSIGNFPDMDRDCERKCPQFGDRLFLLNPEIPFCVNCERNAAGSLQDSSSKKSEIQNTTLLNSGRATENGNSNTSASVISHGVVEPEQASPSLDVVFVHGLRGGPFKSWRIAENKSSTTSKAGLVESIDQEAGKQGTCWPREWLAMDIPEARLFSIKYKTNLTQWSGASLPLQEVSSLLLRKLIAAGIGSRPVVFVSHSMGGLVVKQMLYQAKLNNFDKFLNNTIGVVFYSCPHFGSRLADMPWRMGLVFRPAPSIGELRSGSPRLVELNDFLRHLSNKGTLDVLSFSETQVTPIVEGYGGWALRMEIVPIESAYPGYGELIVLPATDHINSCKPVSKTDPSYAETLEFLKKLKERLR